MSYKISDFCRPKLSMCDSCRYKHTAISKYFHMTFRTTYCRGHFNWLECTRLFSTITSNNITTHTDSIYNSYCEGESISDKSKRIIKVKEDM